MLCSERIMLAEGEQESAELLARQLGVSEILARLLLLRGVRDSQSARSFLEDGVESFHDPQAMRDMEKAVALLAKTVDQGETIFVHGDYDVDGICSTVLLVEAFRELGGRVLHHVPDRFTEGYGVSLKAVETAAENHCAVLITVDCGSSSLEAVQLAHDLGMAVIIADHHHIPEQAPEPEAFLNPHLEDCPYPFKPLCGTGVAFKLVQALYQRAGQPDPHHLLDLVAMATIADVVPLRGENRALVRVGLTELAKFRRPGVKALAEIAGADRDKLGAWSVAFGLGPRLNAAGRLEHARLGVELLLCQNIDEARDQAERLEKLNQRRRDIERTMRDDIVDRLEQDPDKLERGVVVEAGESWHQGVIGITASRIVDRYALPAFVISIEGELAKGSARSPENVDLYQAMVRCQDVFVKFGGHPRAGGFTIETARIDELRERMTQVVAELREGPAPIRVDLTLPLEEATLDLSRELELLEPIGEGNRRPLFLAKGVRLDGARAVGKMGDHLQLYLGQGATRRKAIAFRQGAELEFLEPKKLYYDVLYHLQEEHWDGQTRVSLVVEGILAPESRLTQFLEARSWAPSTSRGPDIWDLRNLRDRRVGLERVAERGGSGLILVSEENQVRQLQQRYRARVALFSDFRPQESFENLILLAPPPSLEWFATQPVQSASRVFLMFGHRELSQELARQRVHWLDRERMVSIWKALIGLSRSGPLDQSALPRVARSLTAPPETVEEAIGVLEELGVATWEGQRLHLGQGRGKSLETSRRFQELVARRQRFLSLRRALGQRHLRLGS